MDPGPRRGTLRDLRLDDFQRIARPYHLRLGDLLQRLGPKHGEIGISNIGDHELPDILLSKFGGSQPGATWRFRCRSIS